MKKLLVITRSLSVTEGQGRYAVEMIKHLFADYSITAFTSELPSGQEKDLAGLNVRMHQLPPIDKLTNPLTYIWQTLRLLPYFLTADLIHFFSDYPYCTFFCFLPAVLKPRFITVHGTNGVAPLDNKLFAPILKRAYRAARKIICVSSFTQKEILRRVKLSNTVVINNGINIAKFATKMVTLKPKPPAEKVILSVGNLKTRKGYHISIPAVAQAKKDFPNLKYYIVGSKPDQQYFLELKQLVEKMNLASNVFFLENLPDEELINYYYLCDLFLLTPVVVGKNKFEGFGLVYLEASACGKPVIGTKNCGAQDAINDGISGILVEPGDISDTALAILRILNDDGLAKQLGENGKTWAEKFSWPNIILKYKAVYKTN